MVVRFTLALQRLACLSIFLHTSTAMSLTKQALRLHVYDHCPFCIRVELALGWSDQPYERVVYGYGDKLGDDSKQGCYDGGVVLTGKKELPVLEKIGPDGQREWLKAESLDIIDWVQEQSRASFAAPSDRADLRAFFRSDGRFKVVQRMISRPRALRMTFLKDWSREEDRAYAKNKYERGGFDYAAAEASDPANLREMNALLEEADRTLLKSDDSLYPDGVLGFDDLLYLPEFRTITLAQGVVWPDRLRNYVLSAHSRANVGTYFDQQIP